MVAIRHDECADAVLHQFPHGVEGVVTDVKVFTRAKQASPCILFFDEMDSLFPRREVQGDLPGRERLTGQFIAELDSMDTATEVVVIGATNRKDLLEPALLNPGRFGIEIALPTWPRPTRSPDMHATCSTLGST